MSGRSIPQNKIGDLTFAAFSCSNLNTNLLAAGDPLVEVQVEAERSLAFAQKMRFGYVIDLVNLQLGLIRNTAWVDCEIRLL